MFSNGLGPVGQDDICTRRYFVLLVNTGKLGLFVCLFVCFNVLCILSFKEHLHEDGHNKWPKHVVGYACYNIINLHVCVCICWLFLVKRHQCLAMNHLK